MSVSQAWRYITFENNTPHRAYTATLAAFLSKWGRLRQVFRTCPWVKSYQWAEFQEAKLLFRFSFHSSYLLIFVGGAETDPKECRPQSDLSIALQSWNYSIDETRGCYSDTLSMHQKQQRQFNCWAVWPYRLGSAHHFPAPASSGCANKGGKQCQLQLAMKGPWPEHRHGTPSPSAMPWLLAPQTHGRL